MTTLDENIASLNAEIESYKTEIYNAATKEEERELLYKLILLRGETLNKLLEQKNALLTGNYFTIQNISNYLVTV